MSRRRPLSSFDRNNALAFFHRIEMVGGQVSQSFYLSRRPKDFDFVDAFPAPEAEVNAEIVLRKVTASAEDLTRLNEISRRNSHPRVQGQRVALYPLQFKADPMIRRTALRLENHRAAFEIFDNDVDAAVVK